MSDNIHHYITMSHIICKFNLVKTMVQRLITRTCMYCIHTYHRLFCTTIFSTDSKVLVWRPSTQCFVVGEATLIFMEY